MLPAWNIYVMSQTLATILYHKITLEIETTSVNGGEKRERAWILDATLDGPSRAWGLSSAVPYERKKKSPSC